MYIGHMSKTEHGAGHIGERRQGQEAGLVDPEAGYRSGWFERVLQRLLSVWFLLSRAQTLGVRAAAFDAAGRIFLVRHTYVAGWHMPGGGVDVGESCHSALVREIREEGNLWLGDPAELFGIYHNRNSAMRDHVTLYVCRNVTQTSSHGGDAEIAGDEPQSLDW